MLTPAGERGVDARVFPLRPAVNNREVFLLNQVALHRETKAPRGGRIFRNQNKPACLAVEPVHD